MSRSVIRRPRDRSPDRRSGRWPTVAALVIAAGTVAGCSSILSEMPQQVGGLPAGVPERPATPPSYPAVNDVPQARADRPMTDAERRKVQADLDAARAAAARRAAAGPPLQAQ